MSLARALTAETQTAPEWVARLEARLARSTERFVFTTSFGLEDQAITHALARTGAQIRFVTLDTGRLFSETLELWAETEARYDIVIEGMQPDSAALTALIGEQGPLGFRQSIEARKACCQVRKVLPLARALAGHDVWITGLRADQSAGRNAVPFEAADAAHGLTKLNPVFDQSREQLADYARAEGVPVNPLHQKGFLSIGCAPCTRALLPGEEERAGRWWWEQDRQKECGLHIVDGRLVRNKESVA
jgi:phosphoadenosine phosphosulfate reductase